MIDVAKAVAAALGPPARALAVPTTLSGAEMTTGHRHAAGVDERTPRVRCAVVVYDPALAASQPEDELAASALNALGHAIEGPCTVAANPVATLAAHDAARRLVGAFAGPEPDRDELALGALLAGYTIDSHRLRPAPRARADARARGARRATGRRTRSCCRTRPRRSRAASPSATPPSPRVLGEPPAAAAARLCARTGATRLRDLGVTASEPRGLRRGRGGAPAARRHAAAPRPRGAARALRGRALTNYASGAHGAVRDRS